MTARNESIPPYAGSREHLLDELVRVDCLLRRHLVDWWADRDGRVDEFRGLYVSDEEVDRLLRIDLEAEPDGEQPRRSTPRARDGNHDGEPSGHFDELTGLLEDLTAAIDERVEHSRDHGVDLRLAGLQETFDLDRRERDALVLALAPDLDPKYEKVYGYLQDDVTRTRPSIGLLLRVLARANPDRLGLRDVFAAKSTLVAERLIEFTDGGPSLSRAVRVPDRVVEYLLGSDAVDVAVANAATVVEPESRLDELIVDDDQRRALDALVGRLGDHEGPEKTLAAFVGSDQRTAEAGVAAVCAALGRPLLRIDARRLDREHLDDDLALLRREVRLQGAPVHVTRLGELEPDRTVPTTSDDERQSGEADDRLERLVLALDAFPTDVFLTGDATVTARFQPRLDRHRFTHVAFPRPGYERRKALWDRVEGLPEEADPATLAARFRLTRGQIEDAVETARSIAVGGATAGERGDTAGANSEPEADRLTLEAILEACRMHSQHRLADLAREVEPTYDWEDIVLPADTLAHLREAGAHVRHRGTVFEAWGFEDRFSLGNGINLLFTGPSGTGKTMAAEIIARDAGLSMFTLDLSSVVSKYIGETEKNLRRVFDEAEHSNAIVFFDEADALFGERTEIGDSHDRYANVEVDYLLQRMEDHDGCIILASNLKDNIDDAFLRRINVNVDFPFPKRDAREAIWRSVFPEEAPVGDLDWAYLAVFELSGGSITNVATTAAFLAADEGRDVEMEHVVRALRREFQKNERLIDPADFGEYREYVD